eukprot:2120920-Pyramimonas_sp.AAC.1
MADGGTPETLLPDRAEAVAPILWTRAMSAPAPSEVEAGATWTWLRDEPGPRDADPPDAACRRIRAQISM